MLLAIFRYAQWRRDRDSRKTERPRAAKSNEEFMLQLSSRSDAPASLWSLRKVFGLPIDFIADFPCYGRGGERSKYE